MSRVMIGIDPGRGVDVIGVRPLKLTKHADVEHHDTQVSENMDWNNLVSWQHNSGYNAANNFPTMPTNFNRLPASHNNSNTQRPTT